MSSENVAVLAPQQLARAPENNVSQAPSQSRPAIPPPSSSTNNDIPLLVRTWPARARLDSQRTKKKKKKLFEAISTLYPRQTPAMSIHQQHTSASLSDAWRTINIDALDPDSSQNFDTTTLHPPLPETSEAEVRQLNAGVRQLLRGGDNEGALRGCLESPVYNGTDGAKDAHLQTVIEVLQSIKASEMTPILQRIYSSEGGVELLDVLIKYLYKGMGASASSGGRTPSRTPTGLTPQQTGFSQVTSRPGTTNESTGSAMSVLLSWHEKVIEVAGLGSIGRCMTDWRRV
ncbi:ARP2/3 complex 16 kDa subunit (p16-Arc)-domain-containing protein [Xylariales sp. PMI_506]|nr:ARP2/3 complex 16 kDa subunit (p16-Arc)-domain-containing protein [Xylariales sp. PMI_506]